MNIEDSSIDIQDESTDVETPFDTIATLNNSSNERQSIISHTLTAEDTRKCEYKK